MHDTAERKTYGLQATCSGGTDRRLAVRRPGSGSAAPIILALLWILFLSGCEQQTPEAPPEIIRAVKTMVVSEIAGGQVRRFAGIVDAAAVSQLSFAVGGKVLAINVDVGDRVRQGEVLARLDQEAFALRLTQTRAELEKAQVELRRSQDDLQRKSKLAETNTIPKEQARQARARYNSAVQSVTSARAQVKLAQRDLSQTEMKAPFNGIIVHRKADPFREVQPGQTLFELEGENEMEVELLIPESLIGWIEPTQETTVEFPAALDLKGHKSDAWVSRIGARADEANAYPVTVTLINPSSRIRPGMTAEVVFTFHTAADDEAYLVPISALLPPDGGLPILDHQHKDASLFVFDEASSTAIKRRVEVGYVSGDKVSISSGVEQGDIVVVAGVHHLHDGQKVRRLSQPSP